MDTELGYCVQRTMFEKYAGAPRYGRYQVLEEPVGSNFRICDLKYIAESDDTKKWYIGGDYATAEEAEAMLDRLGAYLMTHDAKYRNKPIAEVIAAAKAKGYYLAILYELGVHCVWHARFERGEVKNDKPRNRDGSYAPDAVSAINAAFDEIENPGINEKRRRISINALWDEARLRHKLDFDPMREDGPPVRVYKPYALEMLLEDKVGLRTRLEQAVSKLEKSLSGEPDEEEEWL